MKTASSTKPTYRPVLRLPPLPDDQYEGLRNNRYKQYYANKQEGYSSATSLLLGRVINPGRIDGELVYRWAAARRHGQR
jgi:hypothetical protein